MIILYGINLDKPIKFKSASFRFFDKNEHHANRFCFQSVLLMVFNGVLRFSEDGEEKSVYPGQYYIQKGLTYQCGNIVSDSPEYFYIHFWAEWSNSEMCLPKTGSFDCKYMMPYMKTLNDMAFGNYTYTEKCTAFLQLLSKLYQSEKKQNDAERIADFINKNCTAINSLDEISAHFNFSRNHIINIFKKQFGITPFTYLNISRIKYAEYLIKSTPQSMSIIAQKCGYKEYSHFYRMFLRYTGLCPEKMRNTKNT